MAFIRYSIPADQASNEKIGYVNTQSVAQAVYDEKKRLLVLTLDMSPVNGPDDSTTPRPIINIREDEALQAIRVLEHLS